ncbi:alpha/beta hydrolase family protein [Rheinheimera sp. MMS21-TC3]|uniref:alpha/beta hydrolase family protein n=1 Tax=Rheinheimera sp. MMS21-TC3 TaxID=3072790 RepID=UPI0028C3C1C6|nr:prolyl oligopeptidase family serine peptidase [Rheinheimera sp. MMS21-TC3]WNO59816.1 prolyl oligopeptidase family serine peptidase [Rheinheimera sp. MMS21-TC3]
MFRVIIIFLASLTLSLFATSAKALTYQQPDPRLALLLESEGKLSWRLSAQQNWLIQTQAAARPDLAELNHPVAELAGLKINLQQLSSGLDRGYQQVRLQHTSKVTQQEITATLHQRLYQPKLSPDENWLSVVVAEPKGLFLNIINLATGKQARFEQRLNAVLGIQYQWLADSSGVVLLAEHAEKKATKLTLAPSVQDSSSQKLPQRTYQMLLSSTKDIAEFAQLIQARLLKVSTQLKSQTILTLPLYRFSLSPDNQFILTDQVIQPYSYFVPVASFSRRQDIYTLQGQKVVELQQQAVHESRKTRTGMRHITWRPDRAATLSWLAKNTDKAFKEALWQWPAPFSSAPEKLHDLTWQFKQLQWSEHNLVILYESDSATQQERAWFFDKGFGQPASLWYQRHSKDLLNKPGRLLTQVNAFGRQVLKQNSDGELYLLSTKNDNRQQQLNRLTLAAGQAKTNELLWHSSGDGLQNFVGLKDKEHIFYTRQTAQQPPELYQKIAADEQKLVSVGHKTPSFLAVKRQLIEYRRADGVELSGWLYLPAGYTAAAGPLPVLMWAYPRDYASVELAEQQQLHSERFIQLSETSAQPYVALGYAVFSDISMPLIAKGSELANDNFLPQLIANAQAAIDALVDVGVAERDNIAIGGHSYGAFMVANLLAHSDLFTAGIARSGAYNRSLTPFGFQSEKRHFWQQPALYAAMSPFFHADKINAPLLLIHGQADVNSGTYPLQSLRMFTALKGLGKVSRLVMLPLEGHHYQARESVLHVLWEQQQWLAKHLKPTAAMLMQTSN